MKPTKSQMRSYLRKAVAGAGHRYDVHIYKDEDDWEANVGQLESMYGDFVEWNQALKVVEPGLRYDIYVYRRYGTLADPTWELEENIIVDLPTNRGAYEK